MISISSAFDGGNIDVISAAKANDIQLAIRKDHKSDFYQWFHFRVAGARGQALKLKITNAGGASYKQGYSDYQAVCSADRDFWYRAETSFDGKTLTISHTPEADLVYFAYFAPFSMERHADMIANLQLSPRVKVDCLGKTLDGQDLDLLTIGDSKGSGAKKKRPCWVIARQHPGETMAEWWMEGFLERLVDDSDPVARELLKRAVFYVVPNMNPDGSKRGHLRTNAAGANLNREWESPSMARSPEVFLVRKKMEKTGCGFSLDVHGDEALPYNFIAGSEGIPSWTPKRQKLLDAYKAALIQASPDFQSKHGYPITKPGKGNMTMCTAWMAERFGCLAMTLEMPFKDTKDTPDAIQGWSPERCHNLGRANLDALWKVFEQL